MNFQESLQHLKEILLGDIEDIERVAIALFFGAIILTVFFFISRWIQTLVLRRIHKQTEDPLIADFVGSFVRIAIMLFGITLLLRFLGLTGAVGGILAGAGVTAFIIGFALKDIGENILAGILLAFKRPFRIGDIVEISGIRGRVLELNLRDTQVKSFDGKDVFVPNANIIKSPLVNFTIDGFLAYNFVVGLDYGSDYERALKLIEETINTVPGILQEGRSSSVNVSDMGESTLNVTVNYWVNTHNRQWPDLKVKSNAIIAVLTTLEKNGFNLPGNIIELKNHQDKGLQLKTKGELD